jgi:hypothetical protein
MQKIALRRFKIGVLLFLMVCSLFLEGCDGDSFTKLVPDVWLFQEASIPSKRSILVDNSNSGGEGGTYAVEHVLQCAGQGDLAFGTFKDNGKVEFFVIHLDPNRANDWKLATFDTNAEFTKYMQERGVDLMKVQWK